MLNIILQYLCQPFKVLVVLFVLLYMYPFVIRISILI